MLVGRLGMTAEAAAKVVLRSDDNGPGSSWDYDVVGVLNPFLEALATYQVSEAQARAIITGNPSLLRRSEKLIPEKIEVLLSLGVPEDRVGRVLSMCPQIVNYATDALRASVMFLQHDVGLDDVQVTRLLSSFPRVLVYSGAENMVPKIRLLRTLGWSRADVAKTVAKFPQIFGMTLENIMGQVAAILRWGLSLDQVTHTL